MAATDAVCLDLAFLATWFLVLGFEPLSMGFAVLLVAAPLLWVTIFAGFSLYSPARLSPAEEFRRILEAAGVALGVELALTSLFSAGLPVELSTGQIVLAMAGGLLLVLVCRRWWHKRMGHMRQRGELSYRTVILGANQEAVNIAETLQPPSSGYNPIGLIRTDFGWVEWEGAPVLGQLEQLPEIIEKHAIECVFIASSAVGPDLMKRVTKSLRWQNLEVRVSANLTDIMASRLTVQPVGYLLSLSLRPVRLSASQVVRKRALDLLIAGAVAILTSPIWVLIALMVKSTSRGPVLFRQQRVGRDGQLFTIYKFRTMVADAESRLALLADQNEAQGPLFKIRKDPRITRVGRWLRRSSLDELPQLLNVLKGQMSLVGPRPPLPTEVAVYHDWHRDRLAVQPGITGLWQVGGRSELSFDDAVRLDLFYIENWSLTLDLFILGKTVPAVLSSRGAY